MNKKLQILFVVIIILTFSCSENNNEEISVSENTLPNTIRIVNEQNTANYRFEYINNQISSLTGSHSTIIDRFYYENSNLIKIDFENIDGHYDLEYDSQNRLTRYYFWYGENANEYVRTDLEYQGNSITRNHFFKNNSDVYEYAFSEKLTIENSNITKIEDLTNSIILEYQYGEKFSPFKNIDSFNDIQIVLTTFHGANRPHINLRELFLGKNNLVKAMDINAGNSNSFQYDYNSNGLPKKIVNHNDIDNVTVETFEIDF